MIERIPQSIAKRVVFKVFLSADHVTAGGEALTIPVQVSKNGGAFADLATPANATHVDPHGCGWYYIDLAIADTGTLGPLIVRGTEATIDPAETVFDVVPATNAGFSALPDAVAGAALGLPIKDANSFLAAANLPAVAAGNASGLAIVGSAMALTASQHVIVDSGTVTTVTNQLTAAAIATGVWQDATAGDFTATGSIGKGLFTSGVVPGGAGGLAIVGSAVNTTQFAGQTITCGAGVTIYPAVGSAYELTVDSGGRGSVDLKYLDGTAVHSATVGRLAAALNQFLDVAGPTGTVNSLPNAVPGANGGLLIAGTNAATTITTSLTTGAIILTTPVQAALANVAHGGAAAYITLDSTKPIKADLAAILGTALTETAGYLAAAFKKFFNIAGASHNLTVESVNQAADSNVILADAGHGNAALLTVIGTRLPTSTYTVPPTAGAIADAVLDEAAAGHTGVIVVNLDAKVSEVGGGTAPTAAQVADAVWDEVLTSGHSGAGSASVILQAASAPTAAENADAIWDEIITTGHSGAGKAATVLNALTSGSPVNVTVEDNTKVVIS